MAALAPSVAAVRTAVRRALTGVRPPGGTNKSSRGSAAAAGGSAAAARDTNTLPRGTAEAAPLVLVACSGGADSLALAAATAFVAPRLGLRAGLVTVDHNLQPGSADRAADVARWAAGANLDPVAVVAVSLAGRAGGPEAAAREARYQALVEAARRHDAAAVLLGHTRDDQAETVLLALARGSGPRGMAGMPAQRELSGVRLLRPLLEVSREQTRKACAALGLTPWEDPHNTDPAYARARVRAEALPTLVRALGAGTVENLARTATLLAADNAALDALAAEALRTARSGPGTATSTGSADGSGGAGGAGGAVRPVGSVDGHSLAIPVLRTLPDAVRTRVLHGWARDLGATPAALSHRHVTALDALITDWHGQGAVHLPGAITVTRRGDALYARR